MPAIEGEISGCRNGSVGLGCTAGRFLDRRSPKASLPEKTGSTCSWGGKGLRRWTGAHGATDGLEALAAASELRWRCRPSFRTHCGEAATVQSRHRWHFLGHHSKFCHCRLVSRNCGLQATNSGLDYPRTRAGPAQPQVLMQILVCPVHNGWSTSCPWG
jgi:hypothetical protein